MSKRHVLDGFADALESIDGAAKCHQEIARVSDEEAVFNQAPHVAGFDLSRLQVLTGQDDDQRRQQIYFITDEKFIDTAGSQQNYT